jgi:hypothetical protein
MKRNDFLKEVNNIPKFIKPEVIDEIIKTVIYNSREAFENIPETPENLKALQDILISAINTAVKTIDLKRELSEKNGIDLDLTLQPKASAPKKPKGNIKDTDWEKAVEREIEYDEAIEAEDYKDVKEDIGGWHKMANNNYYNAYTKMATKTLY